MGTWQERTTPVAEAGKNGLIITHKTGSMNPFFYDYNPNGPERGIWGPDRSKARRYFSHFAAQAAMKDAVEKVFGEDVIQSRRDEFVVDDYDQPEVERALVGFLGGGSEKDFETLAKYREKAGLASLGALALKTLENDFLSIFEAWQRSNTKPRAA